MNTAIIYELGNYMVKYGILFFQRPNHEPGTERFADEHLIQRAHGQDARRLGRDHMHRLAQLLVFAHVLKEALLWEAEGGLQQIVRGLREMVTGADHANSLPPKPTEERGMLEVRGQRTMREDR